MTNGGFTFPTSERLSGVTSSPVRDILAVLAKGGIISLAGGIPDPTLFEVDDIKACFDHVLTHQAHRALQYSATDGEPELRQAAADRLTAKGFPTRMENIQITTGSQEGIFLVGQTLISRGDVILVEEPTYLAAVQSFGLCGADMHGMECDEDGPVPAALEKQIHELKPKFVYLIPTFQNPSGRTIPLQRRQEIADVLIRTRTPLVEDDPYGELRWEGEPVPTISSLPGMAQQSLLLNSMSKTMAPGVRVAWIRGEGPIMQTIAVAKQGVALQCPVTDQLAVAHYLKNYDLDAHVEKVVTVYKERRDYLYDGLMAIVPEGTKVNKPEGGMFLWMTLPDGWDSQEYMQYMLEEGVAGVPGHSFYPKTPDVRTMRLSFVTNDKDVTDEAVRRMKTAFDRMVAAKADRA